MPSSVTGLLGAALFSSVAGQVLVGVGLSYVIGALSRKKPPAGLPDNLGSRTLTAAEADAAWQVIYGRSRVGGVLRFRHATDTPNGLAWDEPQNVPSTSPYTVTVSRAAEFQDDISVVQRDLGSDGYELTPYTRVASGPGPQQYSVSAGGVYTFNAADAGKSLLITSRLLSALHNRLHQVIVLAAHEVEEIEEIWFGDEVIALDGAGNATGKYANYVYVSKHLGATSQAADAVLMAECPDKWTADHRLAGHAYIYVRCLRNPDLFHGQEQQISAVVKGRKVFDPRSGLTVYSANAALCIADYLAHPVWGLGAAYGTEQNDTLLTAAANICDEDVALAGGGTEKRYTCNGVVSTLTTPQRNMQDLLTSCAGRAVYIGGKWNLYAGAYITPAVTLTESDAAGAIRAISRLSRRDLFNGVKGRYVSEANNWQPSDFPPVVNAVYLAEDGGERIWQDLDLPFTSSPSMAQRLAKIELERVRQQISVTVPLKLGAYRVAPPETLMITNTRRGWSAKPFELLESKLVMTPERFGVDVLLRETASTVYDWNSGEETTVDPAPDTDLPDPFVVAPPGAPSVVETLYETTGSAGLKSKATVTWGASPDGQARLYDLEWKLKSADKWERQAGLQGLFAEVIDLEAGIFMFRVRAVSVIGVPSNWAQSEKELVGLTAAPADITGFAVRPVSGQALVTMDRHVDLDVRIGGRIIVRWSPLSSGATWNDGMLLSNEHFPGDSVSFFVPLLGGTYLAKAQDSSGNVSANAVSFTLTEAHLTGFTTLGTATEQPTFAGAKSNVAAVDGGIQLVGATLWDDLPAIDTVDMIDSAGGIVPSGSYTFANRIDLGSVLTVRLFPNVKSLAFDTADLWDSRTDPIDDWGPVDGGVIEDAEVALEVRMTNDNPAGAPTWGPWHRLPGQADYTARAFEFRTQHTSGSATHNRTVTELSVAAKQPT